ncbi:HlyD family secretion protein [Parapedobacter sp.]
MTSKRIFPADIVKYSVELHYQQRHTTSKIIYLTVLVFFITSLISLFFIQVDVSVNSMGMLTAATERNIVKTPVSGQVKEVFVTENQRVATGDILVTLQADELEQQLDYLASRRRELDQQADDLRQLLTITFTPTAGASEYDGGTLANATAVNGTTGTPAASRLRTPLYRQQYHVYRQRIDQAQLTFANEQTRYNRQKQLFDKKVVSSAEFDQSRYDLRNARNQLQLLYDEQLSAWQEALYTVEEKIRELHAQQQQDANRKEAFYTVAAGVDGTVRELSGVRPGSFVTQGEVLGEISPDSGLVAEIHVPPRDIGLLRTGMQARFQVDAFNHNIWGFAQGNIVDISNDVYISENGVPVFLVKCQLDTKKLHLPNGYEGTLKKGMGVQARFLVARRTLFQLLTI